jgi:hypothetical protein
VRWGNLHIDVDPNGGTSITVQVRSGNTAEANSRSWSRFTTATALNSPTDGLLILDTGSPVAQYLQYRLLLGTDQDGRSPIVDGVQAYFLSQNAAPVIRGIEFVRAADIAGSLAPGGPNVAASNARSPQSTAVAGRPGSGVGGGSPIPTPSPEALAAVLSRPGGPTRALVGDNTSADRPGGTNVVVTDNDRRIIATWDATDPNGDRLRYRIRIKAEDESEWRLLEENISANVLLLATDTLPDGRYRIEVTASDEESNTPENSLSTKLVSRILTIDNTPPVLSDLAGRLLPDGTIRITGRATDLTSTLAAGEFTVDSSKEPRLFLPADGLFDNASEDLDFIVRTTEKREEHIVTIRVFDREGNSSVGRVLVTPAPINGKP